MVGALRDLVIVVLDLYTYIIIAAVIVSWLVGFGVINTHNQIARVVVRVLSRTRLRIRAASPSLVETTIPSWAGTMHDIWIPFTGPSRNFMAQSRHAPTLPSAGW